METIDHFLPTLEHIGILGYWIVFAVAFLESVAFIGLFVPGATVVIVAGVLVARGYFDLGDMIWFAALGAVLGDSLSYYLGTKGTHFFRAENTFLKLAHLNRGEVFFKRHGPKSILFGRFVGPIRSIVPFVAGLSGMDRQSFFLWNVFSGFIWAASHIFVGYFFGEVLHSVEVWASRFGFVVFWVILIILAVWLVVKRGQIVLGFCKLVIVSFTTSIPSYPMIMRFRHKHPAVLAFFRARIGGGRFSGFPLSLFSIAFLYVLILFLGVVQDVLVSETIVAADMRIADFLSILRDPELTQFFLWITMLGKWQVVLGFAVVASSLFWFWGKQFHIVPLWVAILGSEAVNLFGKLAVHRPRPEAAWYVESSFSFPSGHATIAVAFYGFLAYVLWQHYRLRWKWRTNVVFIATIIIFLIGLSRLYLGVHFFSDVWGGYLLGALWLIIGISISEWLTESFPSMPTVFSTVIGNRSAKIFLSTVLVGVTIIFYVLISLQYRPRADIFLTSEPTVISEVNTGIFSRYQLPRFAETLRGERREPINILVIADNEGHLVDAMKKAEWYRADKFSLRSFTAFVQAVLFDGKYLEAPLAPLFWNEKVHAIAFEKPTNRGTVRERHQARFWRTNFLTSDRKVVYVGAISLAQGMRGMLTHDVDEDIDREREIFFTDLFATGLVQSGTKDMVLTSINGLKGANEFRTDGAMYVIVLGAIR